MSFAQTTRTSPVSSAPKSNPPHPENSDTALYGGGFLKMNCLRAFVGLVMPHVSLPSRLYGGMRTGRVERSSAVGAVGRPRARLTWPAVFIIPPGVKACEQSAEVKEVDIRCFAR